MGAQGEDRDVVLAQACLLQEPVAQRLEVVATAVLGGGDEPLQTVLDGLLAPFDEPSV